MNSKLVAHRGYQARYPENTRLAYEQAIQAGALFVETDVLLSRDGVPMLYHDDTLERISNRPGRIADLIAEELIQLPAYEPDRLGGQFIHEPIARLSDLVGLLQQHPQVTAFIEIKEESLDDFSMPDILQAVRTELAPISNQYVLISFSMPLMLAARQSGSDAVGVVLNHWDDHNLETIASLQPDVMFVDIDTLPATGDLHLPNTQTVVYEVADIATAKQLWQRGIDKIETFDIGGMLAVGAAD